MEFKIGDRIITKSYQDLPSSLKNRATARVCSSEGTVVDRLYSEAKGQYIYRIHLDGYEAASKASWTADALELLPEKAPITYHFTVEIAENLAIARMFEDGSDEELASGHGHIFHDGAVGIAQATSYAFKKLTEKLGYEFGGRKNG